MPAAKHSYSPLHFYPVAWIVARISKWDDEIVERFECYLARSQSRDTKSTFTLTYNVLTNSKKAGLVAASLMILLIVMVIFLAAKWPFSEQKITQSLQGSFPVRVSFQKFRPTYFPHPGCVAEGVAFKMIGAPGQTPPIVSIQRLKIEAHYLDIVFRPGYLARIFTKDFEVHVPELGTKFSQSDWKAKNSKARVGEIELDGSILEIARSEDHEALRFEIHKARLKSVSRDQPFSYEVDFRNPVPPGEIKAHGKFGPWNKGQAGATPLSGEYSFTDADLGTFHGIAGTLSSKGKFSGVLGHIETSGDIKVPNFEVTRSHHSVALSTEFHASVDGMNGNVQLEKLSGSFLKTHVEGQGQIASHPNGHGKYTDVDLDVSNGRIQDVFFLFVKAPKSPFSGTTSFRAHVTLPPGKGQFLHKVRLSGDFGIAGGQFTKASTQNSVDTFSERARGEKPEDDKKPKDDKDQADDDRAISNLSGHVDLRNATASFRNFAFEVPGAKAEMHGTYQLEKTAIDLHGTLRSDAELSQMSSGFKSVLLKPFNSFFKKKHAGAVVQVHLLGTYDDPNTEE
jgi:hypothetical protein